MGKKIGILTFWNVPNYGTFLQAYALQKVVSALDNDYDVKQIAYLEKRHYDMYYSFFNLTNRYSLINPRFYYNFIKQLIYFKSRTKKIKELSKFIFYYTSYIPHTITFNKSALENEKFDVILLGSDIIWDYSIDFFNNDVYLFGNKLQADKIYSYAASFGTVKLGMAVPDYVRVGLNKLSAISVRDENSKKLVKEISGKNSAVVCDPTFLWNFRQDINIPDLDYRDYIVVYGSDFPKELTIQAREYADKNNKKLICLDSLDDTFDWCDLNIKQDDMNPFQWLSFFKHADAVMTCTYHGLMFGLIFNKRIIFNPTQFILDKATSLIEYLEIHKPLVEYKTFIDKINWNWDYTELNKKIDIMRSESVDFLNSNIR